MDGSLGWVVAIVGPLSVFFTLMWLLYRKDTAGRQPPHNPRW